VALLGNDGIIPASYQAELNCLPSVESILKVAISFMNEESYE
jgi:hypothetical protein